MVIAATQPWPEARAALESLRQQAAAQGAEVIVAHRGDGLPGGEANGYAWVRQIVRPDGSPYQLRGAALVEAGGDVVAITEDHCVVAPDWVEAFGRAHREHPRAAAIGGAVENGATARGIDWAAFFLGNAYAMAPLRDGDRLAAQANVSYKRAALPERIGPDGFFELDHNAGLAARGEELATDERVVVWHDQSLGVRGTLTINFHAARSVAGLRGQEMSRSRRLLRALVTPVRHPGAIALHVAQVWRKGRLRGRMVAVSPWIVAIAACGTAGTFVGYLAGPGDSPRHVR